MAFALLWGFLLPHGSMVQPNYFPAVAVQLIRGSC